MAKSKAVLQGCESHLSKFSAIAASKIQSTSTGFSEMVQSTHMYHAIKEKIKKVTSTDDAKNGWFVWFKARKDPCQKWLGKDWFDKAFYRFCTAWKKSSVWELIWPEPKRSKVCDSAFCW